MPAAIGTERKQIFAYDRVIKTRGWQSLLIVNPRFDAEANGLLAFCPRLKITLVWDQDYLVHLAPPTERARRMAVLARLQVTERANPRLRILSYPNVNLAAAMLATMQLQDELPPFSGAILSNLDNSHPLVPQVRAWAALCALDGLLIGKQHADLKLRAELSQISPFWRSWPNGLWLLEVKHVSRETLPGPIKPPVGDPEIPPVPPVDSKPSAQRSTPGSEIQARPRARPVWETLEANLAS